MKKLLFLSMLATSFVVNAQNTYPWPTTGNIGIGTTSPTEKLDVVGTTKTKKLNVKFDTNFFGDALNLTNGGNLKYTFKTASGESKVDWIDRNNILRFQHFIVDNAHQGVNYKNKNNQDFFSVQGDSPSFGNFMHLPQPNSRIVIGTYGDYLYADGHKFVVKDGSAMIEGNILTNSNVGIGTSLFVDGSDTYRLSVNGKIRANAVKVYTDWADFVFHDDYNLPSLEEVESYIKDNGHLEHIPSASEVEKNGIELGEMNKLLLQKIEELTLYTIELQKQVNALKAKID